MALESLPQAILDAIVRGVSSSQLSDILSLSSKLRQSALRVVCHTMVIADDIRHLSNLLRDTGIPRGLLNAFLSESQVYGHYVKTLKIVDPVVLATEDKSRGTLFQLEEDADEDIGWGGATVPVPIGEAVLRGWLVAMPALEEFVWTSSALPPDGICETLATYNKNISSFTFAPVPAILPVPVDKSTLAATRSGPLKWDAPSLPHLSQLSQLRTLHITRLSKAGSQALSHLLRLVAASPDAQGAPSFEEFGLDSLTIDVVWFDEELCEAVVGVGSFGRTLRHLCIGTDGTRLRDKGLDRLLQGCDGIEELELKEVHGRISRGFWRDTTQPPTLRTFSVSLSESGPHHTWTADHLHSIGSLPLNTLDTVRVTRTLNPLLKIGHEGPLDDVGKGPGCRVPKEFVDALKGGELRMIVCDWWVWKPEDVKSLLEDCPHLETIRIAFDAPMFKIFSLITSLASVPNLHTISLSIPPQHAPLPSSPGNRGRILPPSPVMPYMPLTPSSSPVKGNYSAISRIIEPPTPPVENVTLALSSLILNDPGVPPVKDIKKLARKCEKLQLLEWYGRNARGAWVIERDPLLKVSFVEPWWSEDIAERVRWEQEAAQQGWKPTERAGHAWAPSAWLKAEREMEKEKEREKEREKEKEREREREKTKEKERRKSGTSLDLPAFPPASPVASLPSPPPASPHNHSQFPLPSTSVAASYGRKTGAQGDGRSRNTTAGPNGRGRGTRAGGGGGGRGRGGRPSAEGARGGGRGGGSRAGTSNLNSGGGPRRGVFNASKDKGRPMV